MFTSNIFISELVSQNLISIYNYGNLLTGYRLQRRTDCQKCSHQLRIPGELPVDGGRRGLFGRWDRYKGVPLGAADDQRLHHGDHPPGLPGRPVCFQRLSRHSLKRRKLIAEINKCISNKFLNLCQKYNIFWFGPRNEQITTDCMTMITKLCKINYHEKI